MFTRREALAGLLKAVVGGGFLAVAWRFATGAGRAVKRVSFSRMPEAREVVHRDGIFLVGTEDGPQAFASKCPHLGCRVDYRPGSEHFRCPCHGSQFDMDGRRVKGPAEKDMTALDVQTDEEGGKCCVELIVT